MCNFDANLNARPPPFKEGMTVVSKGLGNLDPTALAGIAAPGTAAGMIPMAGTINTGSVLPNIVGQIPPGIAAAPSPGPSPSPAPIR